MEDNDVNFRTISPQIQFLKYILLRESCSAHGNVSHSIKILAKEKVTDASLATFVPKAMRLG